LSLAGTAVITSKSAATPLKRLVWLIGPSMFLDGLLFSVLAPLLPGYVSRLGLTMAQAGLLSGAMPLGMTICALPAGLVVVALGGRRALLVGVVAMAVASGGFAAGGGFATLLVARALQGVAGALIWSAGLSWAASTVAPERRGGVIGMLVGIGVVGSVAGPVAGGLAAAVSRQAVFGTIPIVCAALTLAILPTVQRPAASEAGGLGAMFSKSQGGVRTGLNMWFLLLAASAFGLIGVLAPLRLHHAGATAGAIALVFLLGGGAEALTNPVAGRITDRRRTRDMLAGGMVALGLVVGAFAVVDSAPALGLLVVCLSACMGLFGAPVNVNLHRLTGRAGVGEAHAFGLYNLGWAGGNLIGAAGGSALASLGGDAVPCIVVLVAALATSLLAGRADVAL
jgi:predicted MFS family arabinose efflux permease